MGSNRRSGSQAPPSADVLAATTIGPTRRGVLAGAAAAGGLIAAGPATAAPSRLERAGAGLLWQGRPIHLYGPNFNAFTGDLGPAPHVAEIATIAGLWGANCVRLLVAPAEYRERTAEDFWSHLLPILDECERRGLFVVLNWWCIGWPGGASQDIDHWFRFPSYNDSSIPLWTRFWQDAATRLADRGAVAFSLFDEPTAHYNPPPTRFDRFDQWYHVQPLYQDVIQAIRATGAKNLLSLSGGHWAKDFSRWRERPIDDPAGNFLASFHLFAGGEWGDYDRLVGGLDHEIPFLCGGWGYLPTDLPKPPDEGYTRWLESHAFPGGSFIGHCPWSHSIWSDPSALATGWPKPEPATFTPFGHYARAHIPADLVHP